MYDKDAQYPIIIDPLSSSAIWMDESNQAEAIYGFSVASAGDVNGDGYGDVIIGAPYFDNGQIDEGRTYIYYGSSTGLSTIPDWSAESNQSEAFLGWSVASAGDVNGDGVSDIIAGAIRYDNPIFDEGAVFVWYGAAGSGLGLAGTPSNAN